MSANATWPPQLKEWVSRCLQQMTDVNRDAAQAELKQKITEAYTKQTMWTTDWSKVELPSLKSTSPKLNLKRKHIEPSPKKSKKGTILISTVSADSDLMKEQRRKRFAREHEIEKRRESLPNQGFEYSRHVNAPTTFSSGNSTNGIRTASGRVSSKQKYANHNLGYEDTTDQSSSVIDWDRYTIVGRSQSLWKNYLRLTSEPNPNDIRPLSVLQQTLTELKKRWKQDNNYQFACDQLKSIRQDLTVQRIKTKFTVSVYEIHARMALESQDLVEYNQCQSTLRHLYELGLEGNRHEFLAYRILYLIHARNRSDLNLLMATLTPEQKANTFVRHALDVQAAIATSNYHSLFLLYIGAPNMGGYIMDHFVERERIAALVIMTKAYMSLPLSFIATELGFDTATEAHELLQANRAAIYTAQTREPPTKAPIADQDRILDCKAAHKPLFEAKAAKFARVGIKGAI